jgi:hypothetical protein
MTGPTDLLAASPAPHFTILSISNLFFEVPNFQQRNSAFSNVALRFFHKFKSYLILRRMFFLLNDVSAI